MNISNIGTGGVDRGGDRSGRIDNNKRSSQQGPVSGSDRAAISSDGQKAAADFDARVEAAKQDGEDRVDKVARALQALTNGDLNSDAVYKGVAQQILADDFRAV